LNNATDLLPGGVADSARFWAHCKCRSNNACSFHRKWVKEQWPSCSLEASSKGKNSIWTESSYKKTWNKIASVQSTNLSLVFKRRW